MWNSNEIMRVIVCCGFGFPGVLPADVVTLGGDRLKLSGTVRSINEAGIVELVSELSPESLMVKGDAVESINFGDKPALAKPTTAMVELANGDDLPVFVEKLDDKSLTVTSPDVGRLSIPRDCITSMQLGIMNHKVIYSAPRSLRGVDKS